MAGLGELVARLRRLVRADGIHLVFKDREAEELFDRIREEIVDLAVEQADLARAERWALALVEELRRASRLLGAAGWSYSRELRSFLEDPRGHLKKKLFNYVFDLARGRLSEGEVVRRGAAAVRTSLRTNLRSIYQDWVLAAILAHLGSMGGRLIYPETGVILLERSGRQRSGSIPPNAIVRLPWGEVSFFLEAPRPIGWEDTGDLERSWRLYTVLRPDILVYPGRVLDIAAPERDPPILPPHTIIECKELPDWYERTRDLRGPLARPMRATEWRARWLRGLEEGLADILGVERRRVEDFAEGRAKTLRVREHRLLLLYKETFKPARFHLVSRAPIPREIRADLESHGIIIHAPVEIGDREALRGLAEEIAGEAQPPPGPSTMEDAVREALREAKRALEEGGDPARTLALALLQRLAKMGDPLARELLARTLLRGQRGG